MHCCMCWGLMAHLLLCTTCVADETCAGRRGVAPRCNDAYKRGGPGFQPKAGRKWRRVAIRSGLSGTDILELFSFGHKSFFPGAAAQVDENLAGRPRGDP